MEIKVFNTAEEIGQYAAGIFIDAVNAKSNSVLGLATGASPVPTYKQLIKAYKQGKISFKDVITFNLDEYIGLPKTDKNSYYTFMHENLFNEVDVKEENVNFLDGNVADYDSESKRYAKAMLDAGGIDIQLLGIGTNGHIGFNEPADEFTNEAFKVKLTQSTINSNKKYFDQGKMPEYAFTMGIGSIMRAKKIILIATGESKANAIKLMVNGSITAQVPASILNEHSNALILLDKQAASLI